MVNDSIAIILFSSVQKILGPDSKSNVGKPNWQIGMEVFGQFLLVAVGSIGIGIISGLLLTYLFKKLHYLTHSSATENCLILFFGLIAYSLSEIAHLSGVIAVLVAGIVMAHYSIYNLSSTGQISSGIFLATIALFAEAFIYIYLGVSSLQYNNLGDGYAWSWTFTVLEFLVTVVSRVLSVVIPSVIAKW